MPTEFKETGTRIKLLAFICWFELCTHYFRRQFPPSSQTANKHFNINYYYKLFPGFDSLLLEFNNLMRHNKYNYHCATINIALICKQGLCEIIQPNYI